MFDIITNHVEDCDENCPSLQAQTKASFVQGRDSAAHSRVLLALWKTKTEEHDAMLL